MTTYTNLSRLYFLETTAVLASNVKGNGNPEFDVRVLE